MPLRSISLGREPIAQNSPGKVRAISKILLDVLAVTHVGGLLVSVLQMGSYFGHSLPDRNHTGTVVCRICSFGYITPLDSQPEPHGYGHEDLGPLPRLRSIFAHLIQQQRLRPWVVSGMICTLMFLAWWSLVCLGTSNIKRGGSEESRWLDVNQIWPRRAKSRRCVSVRATNILRYMWRASLRVWHLCPVLLRSTVHGLCPRHRSRSPTFRLGPIGKRCTLMMRRGLDLFACSMVSLLSSTEEGA